MASGGVASKIPENLDNLDVSVCGAKAFMTDELRVFQDTKGGGTIVHCAAVACLEIKDSPIHIHQDTLETYVVLSGSGKMLIGDEVFDLSEGSVLTLPPGIRHGAYAIGDQPLKVLITFNPGLAPKEQAEFRDETVLEESTKDYLENTSC